MTTNDMHADDSFPGPCLTEAEVKRFQAAFAFQICLFTGLRSGEVLSAIDRKLAKRLEHTGVDVTMRYVNSGLCPTGKLTTDSAFAHALPDILNAESIATPSSPYNRVYQEQSRADALSAHLSALREQLGDES